MTKKVYSAYIVCPANEYKATLKRGLEIKFPIPREWYTLRRRLYPRSGSFTAGFYVSGRAKLERHERFMAKPMPELFLPDSIVTFDRCLKPSLSGRHENRSHAQAEAQPYDTAKYVSMNVRPMENWVIVKLGVSREPNLTPMRNKHLNHYFSGNGGYRPRGYQAAMKRYAVENVELFSALERQSFDNVETIQFSRSGCHIRQIPTTRRRRSSDTPAPIKRAAPEKNAPNSANRRRTFNSPYDEFSADSYCAEFPQGTMDSQLLSDSQHLVFPFAESPINRCPATVWPVTPIHSIEAASFGTFNPGMNGPNANPKFTRSCTIRKPASNGGDHVFTFLFLVVFCAMILPSKTFKLQYNCSVVADTQVFRSC